MMDSETYIPQLVEEAKRVSTHAYAPYSKFKVGAALLTKNGTIFTGCNVEFADYLVLHAELNAIGAAVKDGETDIYAVAVFSHCSPPVLPCGSCRQKIYEFSQLHNHDVKIIVVNDEGEQKEYWLSALLPSGDIPVEK